MEVPGLDSFRSENLKHVIVFVALPCPPRMPSAYASLKPQVNVTAHVTHPLGPRR